MNAKEVCSAAADILEKEGWCRNKLKGPTGERCSLGAINYVLNFEKSYGFENAYYNHLPPGPKRKLRCASIRLFLRAAGIDDKKIHSRHLDARAWLYNDGSSKNKEQIIDIFRKASESD